MARGLTGIEMRDEMETRSASSLISCSAAELKTEPESTLQQQRRVLTRY